MSGGQIPIWVVGLIVGMGVLALVGLFFYGSYAGVGSSV